MDTTHHFEAILNAELEALSHDDLRERLRFVRTVTSPKMKGSAVWEEKSSAVRRTSTSIADAALTRAGHGKQEEAANRWKKLRTGFQVGAAWRKSAAEMKRQRIMGIALWVSVSLVCGVLSVPPNELLLQESKGCLPTLFFLQYVWILATYVTSGAAKAALVDRKTPLQYHVLCTVLSYMFPTMCGLALSFGLPASVVMVLKALVLVFNMLVGFALLGKRYNVMQIVAVCFVTGGAGATSYSAFLQKQGAAGAAAAAAGGADQVLSVPGLLCMAGALTAVACLGATQEFVSKKHGKHVDEQMFYMHFFSLPLFYSNREAIMGTLHSWWTSDRALSVPLIGDLPYFLVLVVANTLMGDLLKRGTSKLIVLTSALTANLVVSLMRFIALVVSAFWVNAPPFPPTVLFTSGATGILVGSVLYTLGSQPRAAPAPEQKPRFDKAKFALKPLPAKTAAEKKVD